MKAYLIHSPNGTFGQTDAGFHSSFGQESISASAGMDSTDAEISAFILEAGLTLCFKLGDQRAAGDQWGDMFPRVGMPVPPTREGLKMAILVGSKRRRADPHIECDKWGQYRLVFASAPPELRPERIQLDQGNLAYQRAL